MPEFKPSNITIQHVLNAIEKIEKKSILLKPSTRWEVVINNKNYPPKEIMRYAHQEMNGDKIWNYGGGEETNKYLKNLGFVIIDTKNDPIKEIIRKYKIYIREGGLKDEIYKWNLLGQFKGRPNPNAENFFEEIKSINFANLIYPIAQVVIKHIASERGELYKNCFKILFDENIDLFERIKYFNEETLKIYRQIVPEEKFSHHQDERTMATFLTYYNPEKYTLYKHSFYQKYCQILGIKSKKKGEKYTHYLELLNDFIDDYIKDDQELIALANSILPPGSFEDKNLKMLAQDILYQSLDKKLDSRNYWRIGTSDGTKSFWNLMKTENKICIGWNEIGDLNELEIRSKNDIIQLMKNEGFYNDDNRTLSRKSGEIFNFCFDIKIGDIILAQDGANVLGIGIISDDYIYEAKDGFSHQRPIEWKTTDLKFWNEIGLRTSVYKLTDLNLTHKIDSLLNDQNDKLSSKTNSNKMKISLNQILYGPPGTGKTYNTVLEAAKIITNDEAIDYDYALEVFNKNLNDQIEFITFHQNYSYEDFIQGIRPDIENGKDLSFEKKDGVFKRIADRAHKNLEDSKNPASAKKDFHIVFQELIQPLVDGDTKELEIKMIKSSFYITEVGEKSIEFRKNIGASEHTLSINTLKKMYEKGTNDIILGGLQPYYNPILTLLLEKGKNQLPQVEEKNYVIIIDEINRANISRVFGELITLIEEDKRSHGKIPMSVTLPSGDSFIVPSNLYIIGTMNTADKSIALLDIALRRRFEFVPMYPKYEGLEKPVNFPDVLQKINEKIKKIKGPDFQIGHSYFMENENLLEIMNIKVIPLLLEYFMNDETQVKEIITIDGYKVDDNTWPLKLITA